MSEALNTMMLNLAALKASATNTVLEAVTGKSQWKPAAFPRNHEEQPDHRELPVNKGSLERVLELGYRVKGDVQEVLAGPTFATYAVKLPLGAKTSNISGREEDIARDLQVDKVRVVPKFGNTGCMGVEIPMEDRLVEEIKDNLHYIPETTGALNYLMGVDANGDLKMGNLAKAPHLLVAGTTGSGKSVFLNSLMVSLLARHTPDTLQLLMVDPKRVEFAPYASLPHLKHPIANTIDDAMEVMHWAVQEMERRGKLLAEAHAKNITDYNQVAKDKLPWVVLIIDEFADLMMSDKNMAKVFEEMAVRIAQKARAAGIHMVLATQKPTVKVVTSLLKGNIPSRVSFQVASASDSRVILDENGADLLLGKGDMLYTNGTPDTHRLQGLWVPDETIHHSVRGST